MRITAIVLLMLLPLPAMAEELPWLRVQGKNILDANGKVMSMRGINVGSWLMMETWIPSLGLLPDAHLIRLARESDIEEPFKKALEKTGKFDDDVMKYQEYVQRIRKNLAQLADPAKVEKFWRAYENEPPIVDAVSLDRLLRKRFGAEGATEIWEAFHRAWITEEDFRSARQLGFNSLRIPFWYRWFEDDEKPGQYKNDGFRWLDKAVAMARQNGLYVILDLHGAPGGQSPWEHTGQLSRGELFVNADFQKRTYALWAAIARHFKDEPAVFAYDCLNEPASAKGTEDWTRVHGGIYDAIRSADPKHIILMEDGYKTEDKPYSDKGFFPIPKQRGWSNIVYSLHFYQTGTLAEHRKRLEELLRVAAMEQDRCGVPIYIGEFNTISDDPVAIQAMGIYCTAFNQRGIHWSPWTLKYVGGDKTTWGVVQYAGKWELPDVQRDTKADLLAKIARYRAANFRPHEVFAATLKECLAQPVVPAEPVKP